MKRKHPACADPSAVADALLRALDDAGHPLRLAALLRATGLSSGKKRDMLTVLHRLTMEGTLLRLRDGAWTKPKARPEPPAAPAASRSAFSSVPAAPRREDDVAVQEELTKLNHHIPTAFPAAVLAEARAVTRRTTADEDERRDLRDLPLVTIDGEDARDFDDAIAVLPDARGWRLIVAIADVSLYVRPRSGLDREAKERGNSFYFPASVEPMLPPALSNDACSLRPGEDRPVLAADMTLSLSGAPIRSVFYAGIMRSRARLTYHAAQAELDMPGSSGLAPEVQTMLAHAGRLAGALMDRRQRAGGLDFAIPEPEFVMEKNRVLALRRRQRLFSHRLIEAFMVTANEAVAEFLTRSKTPFLYRAHPEPDREKLEFLVRSLRILGLPLPRPIRDASWLPALLRDQAETGQSDLVARLALRAMMQARYTPEAEGHFGLASARYCHFTSPIRRYADLLTHRALRHALGLKTWGGIPAGRKLLAAADICNARERAAKEAEREITRRIGCLCLRDSTGQEFHGVVSGVTPFGVFVELRDMPVEGMIRVESLGKDFYEYDPDRQELRGRATGDAWRLGMAVDVRLTEVNTGRLEIAFVPAGRPPVPHRAMAGKGPTRLKTARMSRRNQQKTSRDGRRERAFPPGQNRRQRLPRQGTEEQNSAGRRRGRRQT